MRHIQPRECSSDDGIHTDRHEKERQVDVHLLGRADWGIFN